MRRKFPMAVEEVQEAVFDVRLNVDGAVDTSSVNSVVKMLKDKGIMAKVQPSERDGQAVTINSSASKNRVINVLGNIVDEEVQETHSFVTNKQNQKQKEVGGEKEPIKTTKNEWKTFAMMAAELREKKEQKKEDKKEMQAGDDTRDKKQKTMTGEIATSPEMNPKVDYKY
jgi:predicted transcriptional regulator